ncbi:Ig-like domain-containing protein [Microbacterium sp. DT81.1]|uniref:Ig-like domain-containing protein n=1 Tax=Microbacterium sp. DT81.1 TaxID=3393413 RepID=UPI003CF16104
MPPMTQNRRSLSRAAIAVGAVIALVAADSSAYAAEPPTIVIPTTGGTTSVTWTHPLPTSIDPSATSLMIHSYEQAEGETVHCTLLLFDSPLVTATFTAEEWDAPGPVEMGIPDGALSDGVSDLTCTSDGGETNWTIYWSLDTSGTGGMNSVDQDDDFFYHAKHTVFDPGPSHVISPGATVLLEGPWEYPEPEWNGYASATLTSSNARFAPINLSPTFPGSDPYGLVVQIPTDLPAGFTDTPATLAAASGGSREAGGSFSWRTSWSGPVSFGAAAPSNTFLALERSLGTSRERLTASARVTTAAGVDVAGTMDFFVDSKLVGSVAVAADGRASLLLPKLPRGKHVVVATFRGTDAVKSSSSAASSLRILI